MIRRTLALQGQLFIDPPSAQPPEFSDLRAAAGRLAGVAVRTPLLESPLLNEKLGFRLLLKAEPLQRTGSFKIRGAYNKISQLSPAVRSAGVVAFSSGNHAQGVACAAALLGVPAVIAMPRDAPAIKIENTRAYGAEVIFYERGTEDREAVAAKIAQERGVTLVPPFDDPDVVAGQGTLGIELAEQAAERDATLDLVFVPCGGGGLIAGCALALDALSPATDLYAAEPEGSDDLARSLAAGRRVAVTPGTATFCDALLSPVTGELTYAIMAPRLAGALVLRDEDVAAAMRTAFAYFKLVLEPGGAVALAAALSGQADCRGRTVAVVASGGNADSGIFAEVIGKK